MVDVSKDEKKEDDIITVDVQDTESENSDIKISPYNFTRRRGGGQLKP